MLNIRKAFPKEFASHRRWKLRLHELKGRADEITNYFSALLYNSGPEINKFVIFGHYRTGSNLLTSLLNSHPEIICDGEIFRNFLDFRFRTVVSPHLYMNGLCIRTCIKTKKNRYGCNLKLHQLANVLTMFHRNPKEFMLDLYEDGWRIIHLCRLNWLRQAISIIAAKTRDQYHDTPTQPLVRSRLYIDCNNLVESAEVMENYARKEEETLDKLPHLKLVYENDLLRSDKHQITLDRIFEYLGLDSAPVKTTFTRVSSDKLSDYVQNYEELVRQISKTKYARFLED